MEAVSLDLTLMLKQCSQLSHYILPLGGTFNWRRIAGTARISPHSWGIAIDLNPRRGAYWRGYRVGFAAGGLCENYPPSFLKTTGLFGEAGGLI